MMPMTLIVLKQQIQTDLQQQTESMKIPVQSKKMKVSDWLTMRTLLTGKKNMVMMMTKIPHLEKNHFTMRKKGPHLTIVQGQAY